MPARRKRNCASRITESPWRPGNKERTIFTPRPFVPRFSYAKPWELRKVFGREVNLRQLQDYIQTIREKGIISPALAETPPMALAESLWLRTTRTTKLDGILEVKARFYCPDVAQEIDSVRAHLAPQFARTPHKSNISLCVGEMKNLSAEECTLTQKATSALFHLIPGEVKLAKLDARSAASDPYYAALLSG